MNFVLFFAYSIIIGHILFILYSDLLQSFPVLKMSKIELDELKKIAFVCPYYFIKEKKKITVVCMCYVHVVFLEASGSCYQLLASRECITYRLATRSERISSRTRVLNLAFLVVLYLIFVVPIIAKGQFYQTLNAKVIFNL